MHAIFKSILMLLQIDDKFIIINMRLLYTEYMIRGQSAVFRLELYGVVCTTRTHSLTLFSSNWSVKPSIEYNWVPIMHKMHLHSNASWARWSNRWANFPRSVQIANANFKSTITIRSKQTWPKVKFILITWKEHETSQSHTKFKTVQK